MRRAREGRREREGGRGPVGCREEGERGVTEENDAQQTERRGRKGLGEARKCRVSAY